MKTTVKQLLIKEEPNTIDCRLIKDDKTFYFSNESYYTLGELRLKSDDVVTDDYKSINDFEVNASNFELLQIINNALNRKVNDNFNVYDGIKGKCTLNGEKYCYEVRLCDCY